MIRSFARLAIAALLLHLSVKVVAQDTSVPDLLKLEANTPEDPALTAPPPPQDRKVQAAIDLAQKGFVASSLLQLVALVDDGSQPMAQTESLQQIEWLARNNPYDRDLIERLALRIRIKAPTPATESFLAFHSASALLRSKQPAWSKEEAEKISSKTVWATLWDFHQALRQYRDRNQPRETIQALRELLDRKATPTHIRQRIELAIARLQFEAGDYERADEQYARLQLNVRDWGRVTLERAWALYHLRNYSKALGLLQSLRAPFFSSSLEPERASLELMVLGQVCHASSIVAVVADARKTYARFTERLKKRSNLADDVGILNQALMEAPLRARTQAVEALVKEIPLLERSGVRGVEPLVARAKLRERELRSELRLLSSSILTSLANENLKFLEQIEFLDYQARLTISRQRLNSNAPKGPAAVELNRVVWPQRYQEFWRDEFPLYQIQLDNRCGA